MPPASQRSAPQRRAHAYTVDYTVDLTASPQPRHHVILLDGTWNDEQGTLWTNPLTGEPQRVVTSLVKLDRALAPDNATQVVSYHRGIGNATDNRRIQQLFTGAVGADEACIRAGAYAQFALDYRPGDVVSIFGFSRGAACARMLANDLARHGVPSRLRVTRRYWNGDYRIVAASIPRGAERRPVEIAYLGLWDTVGAFGIPVDLGPLAFGRINVGKDLSLAPNVGRAVHCLALDEDRKAFDAVPLEGPPEVVDEVWFPGVHSDIGGGYGFDGLGKLTFAYQLARWEETLAALGAPPLAWHDDTRHALLPSTEDLLVRHRHDSAPGGRRPRTLRTAGGGLPRVHASVDALIAAGAGWVAENDEKAVPVRRAYLPPNYTARDPRVVVGA